MDGEYHAPASCGGYSLPFVMPANEPPAPQNAAAIQVKRMS